jgi:hypothetical protein
MEETRDPIQALLSEPLVVINLGLRGFGESLQEQKVDVVFVDWSPPASGDQDLIEILDQLI